MLVLANAAASKDFGLLVTFIGIGIVVSVLIGFAFFQSRGEFLQNQDHLRYGRDETD